jgi:uncharacterized protein YndB with AHSA1/START domain
MDPVTVSITIARPREEVFAYLADVANHPEFTDHFLVDWRLTREDTFGSGAGARYRVRQRGSRYGSGDVTFGEVAPPRRLLGYGRSGRFNSTRQLSEWVLEPASGEATRVTLTIETQTTTLGARVREALFGARGFARRRWKKALRRLQAILEDGEQRGVRATISGGARKPATGFRL